MPIGESLARVSLICFSISTSLTSGFFICSFFGFLCLFFSVFAFATPFTEAFFLSEGVCEDGILFRFFLSLSSFSTLPFEEVATGCFFFFSNEDKSIFSPVIFGPSNFTYLVLINLSSSFSGCV